MATSDRKGQYRSNNEKRYVPPGSTQGPHPASHAPPTPTDGPPLPYDDEGDRVTGTCGGAVGVGGRGDEGWGPCADPGSPSTPYLSGIDRKGRDGINPSTTHLRVLHGKMCSRGGLSPCDSRGRRELRLPPYR